MRRGCSLTPPAGCVPLYTTAWALQRLLKIEASEVPEDDLLVDKLKNRKPVEHLPFFSSLFLLCNLLSCYIVLYKLQINIVLDHQVNLVICRQLMQQCA